MFMSHLSKHDFKPTWQCSHVCGLHETNTDESLFEILFVQYISRTKFEIIPTIDCISVVFIRADYCKGVKYSI